MDKYTAPNFSSCALLSIDMQIDFADNGRIAAKPLASLIEAFRRAGRLIVHIVRLYDPDGLDVDVVRRARIESGEPLIAPGSPGVELMPEIRPEGAALDAKVLLSGQPQKVSDDEIILFKPRWGAFYRTPLQEILRSRGVDTVVIAGTYFPNCVRATIYEANSMDFRVAVPRDAVAGLDEAGCQWLETIGCVCMTAEEAAREVQGEGSSSSAA
jgi:nicotinamidase-related amidase